MFSTCVLIKFIIDNTKLIDNICPGYFKKSSLTLSLNGLICRLSQLYEILLLSIENLFVIIFFSHFKFICGDKVCHSGSGIKVLIKEKVGELLGVRIRVVSFV